MVAIRPGRFNRWSSGGPSIEFVPSEVYAQNSGLRTPLVMVRMATEVLPSVRKLCEMDLEVSYLDCPVEMNPRSISAHRRSFICRLAIRGKTLAVF